MEAREPQTAYDAEAMREWVDRWARVGPELERIIARELDRMTDEEAHQQIRMLFENWKPPSGLKRESGLVELQKWFRRFREKGMDPR